MGLDNIPHRYPCLVAGTAVMTPPDDEGHSRISCDATIEAGQCPWHEGSRDKGSPTYGMLGVPCWYRGKSGNWMLDTLKAGGHTPPGDFYGESDQEEPGPQLPPEFCEELGRWMEDHVEAYAALVAAEVAEQDLQMDDPAQQVKEAIEQYRYAAWWLRFIGEKGEGSDTWY